MSFEKISLMKKDKIGIITINREDRYNALDLQTEMEIGAAIDELDDESIKGVIITGAGGKGLFSRG